MGGFSATTRKKFMEGYFSTCHLRRQRGENWKFRSSHIWNTNADFLGTFLGIFLTRNTFKGKYEFVPVHINAFCTFCLKLNVFWSLIVYVLKHFPIFFFSSKNVTNIEMLRILHEDVRYVTSYSEIPYVGWSVQS